MSVSKEKEGKKKKWKIKTLHQKITEPIKNIINTTEPPPFLQMIFYQS